MSQQRLIIYYAGSSSGNSCGAAKVTVEASFTILLTFFVCRGYNIVLRAAASPNGKMPPVVWQGSLYPPDAMKEDPRTVEVAAHPVLLL